MNECSWTHVDWQQASLPRPTSASSEKDLRYTETLQLADSGKQVYVAKLQGLQVHLVHHQNTCMHCQGMISPISACDRDHNVVTKSPVIFGAITEL